MSTYLYIPTKVTMYVCRECLLLTKKKHFELVIDVTFFLKYLDCCKKDGEYSAPSFQSYESIKFYDLIKILVLVFPTSRGNSFRKIQIAKHFFQVFSIQKIYAIRRSR